jgi:hypothetical protein
MASKYLDGDGIKYLWTKIKALFVNFNGASSTNAGTAGQVPAPGIGQQGLFLRGDGNWGTPTDTSVGVTLGKTTKAYLLGTTTTPTSTEAATKAIADTGVYLDTTAGRLTATSFSGSGAALTSLNASNLSSGTVGTARLPVATSSAVGVVKAGKSLTVASDGTINAPDFAAQLDDFGTEQNLITPPWLVKEYVASRLTSVYKPAGSRTLETLPALTDGETYSGNVYNMTAGFTTTDDFIEGKGNTYPAGTNVVIVPNINDSGVAVGYKYDVLAGFVDLSGYVQSGDIVALTNSEIDSLMASV